MTQNGLSIDINYSVTQCSFGWLLAASTAKGVCAIAIGSGPQALIQELYKQFPEGRLFTGDLGFQTVVEQVTALVENPRAGHHFALDIHGAEFQQKVWKALTTIPAGETASYSQIAAKIGLPGSARAVAGACAANTLAVAIPCHRVVRSDGALSGYRWGVEVKRRLLDLEAPGERLSVATGWASDWIAKVKV